MQYYKNLVFMDGEKARVTPDQFQAYVAAKQRGDKDILIDGNMIALSSISRTEDTMTPLPGPPALPGTTQPGHKHEPRYITEPDGHVFVDCLLIKMRVPRKYYEKWLVGRSLVHVIEQDGAFVWVAMSHTPCKDCGITKDDALECEPEEYARFRPGWKVGGYANVQNNG